MTSENGWLRALKTNSDHAKNYAERWTRMVAEGQDIFGEARLIDAMVDRESVILDAGCGTGRVGGYLVDRGHHVIGVDFDAYLIEVAKADHPDGYWRLADLAELDLRTSSGDRVRTDVTVMAGNVMTFVQPADRVRVLSLIREHLVADGRFVCGFGAGRGYEFAEFQADLVSAGLHQTHAFGTWDLRPPTDEFLVSISIPAPAPAAEANPV